MTVDHKSAGEILIVDDIPENLQVLSSLLKARGYRVRPAPSGRLALRAARSSTPDLILLDANMPRMSGFEVCAKLKADPALREIPVLFVSALGEPMDKVRAFKAGAVDYITKPFQTLELEARIETQLRLQRMKRETDEAHEKLRESYEALSKLQQLRDALTHMIVHDMRTPLSAVITSLSFLNEDVREKLAAQSQGDLDSATLGGRRLMRMIDDLLDIGRFEAGEMPIDPRPTDIGELVSTTIDELSPLLSDADVQLHVDSDSVAVADAGVIRRIIENLLGNASKFNPPGMEITVTVTGTATEVRISVDDHGPGIDPAYRAHIFEKFAQVEPRSQGGVRSTGLGLAFCRLAVEAHHGGIGITEPPHGTGSRFWVSLPRGAGT